MRSPSISSVLFLNFRTPLPRTARVPAARELLCPAVAEHPARTIKSRGGAQDQHWDVTTS